MMPVGIRVLLVNMYAIVAIGALSPAMAAPSSKIAPGDAASKAASIVVAQERIPEVPAIQAGSIDATIINPYQVANMGSEVSGIIEAIRFDEGQRAEQNQVIAEISKKRYSLLAEKAKETLKGLEFALALANDDLKLKEELLRLDGTTRQELLKAKAEREIAEARVEEAKKDLRIAQLNLDACQVRAPFTGFIAVRYKQPFEPVERLEKIFAIVDSSKVYAVANVPDDLLPKYKIGAKASFKSSAGKKYTGTIDKVGKLLDPKSRTKRVYLLIDNAKGELELGQIGSLSSD